MKQRLATIATALTLVGALFAGTPSAVRADPATIYLGIYGADYTGAVAGCRDLDLTVSAGQDSSMGLSLASDAAHTDGTVYICPGTYHFTYPVDNPPNNIHLIGAGATRTILDGGNTSRIVASEGSLVIESLTMQNAHGEDFDEGGAVLAGGTVSVTNAIFKHNFANKGGGAIAAFGAVTALDSVFVSNSTADQGGAIASHESVTVTNSSFTSNASIADSECIGGGGAIASAHDVTAINSVFTSNVAKLGANTDLYLCGRNGFGGFGGAIATLGYETIVNSTFTGNKAALIGGAIFSANSALTKSNGRITQSRFTSNDLLPLSTQWSTGIGILYLSFGQSGSAVATFSTSPLIIDLSTFSGNGHRVNPNGPEGCGTVFGRVLDVSDSTFIKNQSQVGSGLCSVEAVTVHNVLFMGNVASQYGGAMYGYPRGLVDVSSSSFVNNRAAFGGAIATDYGCTGEIQGSVFKGNYAVVKGPKYRLLKALVGLGGAVLTA